MTWQLWYFPSCTLIFTNKIFSQPKIHAICIFGFPFFFLSVSRKKYQEKVYLVIFCEFLKTISRERLKLTTKLIKSESNDSSTKAFRLYWHGKGRNCSWLVSFCHISLDLFSFLRLWTKRNCRKTWVVSVLR